MTQSYVFPQIGSYPLRFDYSTAHSACIRGYLDTGAGENYIIDNNTFMSVNPGGSIEDNNTRWLIYTRGGAKGNSISFNKTNLDAGLHDDLGACAIHCSDTKGTLYCENQVNHTYRGLHLSGNISPVTIAKNKFNEHKTGMYLQTTFCGVQKCHANTFLEGYNYSFAARFDGSIFGNTFLTDPDEAATQMPDPVFPPGWFAPHLDCQDITPNCGSAGGGGGPEDFTERDSLFIKESIQNPSPETARSWQQKREIFYKFINHPNLISATMNNQTFYNLHKNTSVHRYAQMDSLLIKETLYPVLLGATITENHLDTRTAMLQLESVDNTFDEAADAEDFNSTFWSAKQSVLDDLEILHNDQISLRSQADAFNSSVYTLCENFNQTLPIGSTWVARQKEVNLFFIKSARGLEFTESELNQLRVIANECPEISGEARTNAIALLPVDEQSDYANEENSVPGCERSEDGQYPVQVILSPYPTVFPNPAFDKFIIFFGKDFFQGQIEVSGISGQIIYQKSCETPVQNFSINTSNWNHGVYFLKIKYPMGETKTLKIIH